MIKIGGFLEILSKEELQEIHDGSLQILEEAGCYIPHQEILDLFHQAGAKVDFKDQTVKIPGHLVEELIKKAPESFTWCGRRDGYDIEMEGSRVHFGPASSAIYTIDVDGNRRRSTIQDAHNFVRLIDVLEHIDEGYCVVHPGDVLEHAWHAHMMYAMFKNSPKPFRGRIYGTQRATDCVNMAAVVAGGLDELAKRPTIITNVSTVSPLSHGKEMMEGMLVYIRHGLPVIFTPEVQAGATGPVTLAGTLVLQNAEVLSGICIAQLVKAGAPVIYGTVSSIMDMRSGTLPYAAIEATMINTATAQMARFYRVPSRGTGGFSDSKALDMQAGFETALTLYMAAASGLNYIIGSAGAIESTLTASYEKLIIDEEILGMITRYMQGITVNTETKAIDLISSIGPKGQFLNQRHTMKFLREEHFMPELVNRERYEIFCASGEKDLHTNARQKAQRLLEKEHPNYLSEDVDEELKKMILEVESREQ